MQLTGQCKQDFERWYLQSKYFNDYYIAIPSESGMLDTFECISFYRFPDSFKWGVFQDFADSKGYYLHTERGHSELGFTARIREIWNRPYKSRLEARTAAIEKFCELYNKQHQ